MRRTALKPKRTKICQAPNCGKPFKPGRTTQRACGVECALAVHRHDLAEKDRKESLALEKQYRKDKRDYYRKKLSWQHKQTQPVFNRMRRLEEILWFLERGLEAECTSCGKNNMDWCCGHFKTVGAQSGLRYDPVNTYLQCNKYCNKSLSGNIEGNKNTRGYKQGLVDRFGAEKAKEIIDYCETNTDAVHWAWQDLEEFRAKCSAKCRELESKLMTYTAA